MNFKQININNILIFFLLIHLFTWTLIPSISNNNLPLDTIEALAWASNLEWGFSKHPPLSAFFVEFFFKIFGSQDWAYYFLSQIFVISSFYIVYKFSEDFFNKKILCLVSLFLLEGIYFYNYTTPEFNVNICQLPFWTLTVYYCWKGFKKNDNASWLLFGLFAGLGFLSKYLFIYLLIALDIFFVYMILNKKINFKCLISLVSFFIILLPHLIWLHENDYTTIRYALHRTGFEELNFLNHLHFSFQFLGKQIGILIPFFIMIFLLLKNFTFKINFKDKKLIFLFVINFVPIIFMFFTSLTMGIKIRTMWMTPFYLFIGVFFIYLFQKKIDLKKIKNFISIFLLFFILSPAIYLYVSISEKDKRTDYPGKKISKIVQQKWNENFANEIGLVGGDEWHGGNLSYHIKSRPKWDNILENGKKISIKDKKVGFVLIGDSNILSNICSGVFFEVEKQGICMIGSRK